MRLPAVVLVSVLLLPSAASASTYEATATNPCKAGRLTTCASVHVQYFRPGAIMAPVVSIGLGAIPALRGGSDVGGFRFQPLAGQVLRGDPANPQILAIFADDEERRECEIMGRECRTETVVTPEPVTMTLLATGLIGMAGASRLRRRQKQQPPV